MAQTGTPPKRRKSKFRTGCAASFARMAVFPEPDLARPPFCKQCRGRDEVHIKIRPSSPGLRMAFPYPSTPFGSIENSAAALRKMPRSHTSAGFGHLNAKSHGKTGSQRYLLPPGASPGGLHLTGLHPMQNRYLKALPRAPGAKNAPEPPRRTIAKNRIKRLNLAQALFYALGD